MKTILATAYAINPYKGSEDGMGWNFVMQIARFHKVIAITRQNNRTHIERYMDEHPDECYARVHFLYFDLPAWMRFWKKGSRGAILYYLMWQFGVVSFVKKQRHLPFDITHHLNFHNDWSPSYLWKLGKPFVWGPIGHHPLIPAQYLKPYSRGYWIKDRFTWLVKQYFWKFSSALRSTRNSAAHIWCMNNAIPGTLGLKARYSVVPSVATRDFGWVERKPLDNFLVISAGRFVPLKGFDLTVEAFAAMLNDLKPEDKKKCRLMLVGSGPAEAYLRQLTEKYYIEEQVEFIPWMERSELMQTMKTASVFLFPSHEGAGMVIPEALSFGLPVVCLDNEGPGEFIPESCGITVPQGSYTDTVKELSYALRKLYDNPKKRLEMGKSARKHFEKVFHWDRRGEQLQKIYAEL